MKHRFFIIVLFCLTSILFAQNNPFFTGAGGNGVRIAVLQPSGTGLSAQEQWLLRLVQSTLTGDFNRYSAMTVIDRQNLEKILGEQNESLSGNYSDKDFVSIGHLTNARYICAGNLTKTRSGFMLELAVSDVQSGVRSASFTPKNCTLDDLQSTSIIRQASEDLLSQMGVTLTDLGKQSLKDSVSSVPQTAGAADSADTSSTVTSANGERLSFIDYLSRTADTLYAIGEGQESLYYYRALTYYFPWYYKGWLGIVRCFSRDYTNFNFIDSEVYMERASITAVKDSEKQEVQKVRAAFDAQWPSIVKSREQQAIEEAKRRADNFHRMKFKQEGNKLIEYTNNNEEVIIPEDITIIGHAAFRQKARIKRIVLHNKVTTIEREAFANCAGLEEVVIPSSVTSIGSRAFANCTSLTSIVIPAGIDTIPERLFESCRNLKNVTIGSNIKIIDRSAFNNCESLTSIIIPRSVQSLGDFAFSNCKNLKNVTLLNDKITIGRRAFMGCPLANKEEMIKRFGETIFN